MGTLRWTVEGELNELKPLIERHIYHGDFWLSINRRSDYWIFLRKINQEDEFHRCFSRILTLFIERLLTEDEESDWYLVFCGKEGTKATELDLAEDIAASEHEINVNLHTIVPT